MGVRGVSRDLLRVARLGSKALFKVVGAESWPLLQGLLTNDLGLLANRPPPAALYSFFLNSKGRVLNDSFLYSTGANGEVWVECDKHVLPLLHAHIRMYRLRKKAELVPLQDELETWVAWGGGERVAAFNGGHVVQDPRLVELGSRLLLPKGASPVDQLKSMGLTRVEQAEEDSYRAFRYTLGVGEGGAEIPWASSFPLEMNCDFLGGVSFEKGCYIGQELTARTHHTGVVRKRLMPLFFADDPPPLAVDTPVEAGGKLVGKLKGVTSGVGLALLRVSDALSTQELNVGGFSATTEKPSWWPPLTPNH